MGGMVSRPDIRGSAGAGFGTGLYTAPFRQRPGVCRYKARPSHTQRFLRLHPVSLAPMRQRPGLRFPIPHLESFPPRHPGSACAGFGTGLCTAPFRRRPGIRRYKARPSHTQHFLRLHPGSLAPMRQRPGLVSHPASGKFPAHIRAALACPLSVDRDGFLSLSLSLTEGNAPPFGPIRGRQRLEIPRSIAPAQGFLCRGVRFPPRRRPDRRQGPGCPFPRIFSGRTPDTRQKSCGTLDQEPKRPPRQAAEVPHRQQ